MKKILLLALWLLPCFTPLLLISQNWEIETIRDNIVGAWSRTADFDLDGDPDILVQAGDSILWYENLRPGWAGHLIDPTFFNSVYAYVDVVDIDSDGDMDVIKVPATFGDGTEELTWNENIENGASWEKHLIITMAATAGWFENAYGDLDGDGDIDISVAEYDFVNPTPLGSLYWLEQTPGGWVKHPLKNGNHWLSSIADMDGDGDLDIMASWDSIFWLENNLPTQDWTEHFVASSIGAGFLGTCADMSGDGLADVISAPSGSSGGLALFINPAWEEFTVKTEFGIYPGVPGDIDGDGDLDLPYGGAGFGFVLSFGWAENQNDGTEWVLHDVIPPSHLQIIPTGVADIDGDGDMDLVALTFNTDMGVGSVFWAANPQIVLPRIKVHSITTARQSGGDHGYTLDGIRMKNTARPKLLNQANFGTNGSYPKSVSITDAYGTAGSLENIPTDIDLFYFGIFNTLEASYIPFTEAELDSLYAWSERGGKLIIGASAPGSPTVHNPNVLNAKWGFDVLLNFPSTTIIPTQTGTETVIFNGPFGEVPTANQGGFAKGYFNLLPDDVVILGEDASGNPALVLDCKTLDLIVADGDAFTDLGGISAGNNVVNNNDRFWLNTIAYMDQLQGPPVVEQDGFTLSTSGYLGYQWLLDGQPIVGATDSVFTVITSGNYSVKVSMSCGCEVSSKEVFVVASGTSDAPQEVVIGIFPNPATEQAMFVLFSAKSERYEVQILDVNGKLMESMKMKSGTTYKLNLTGWSAGNYVVRVFNEKSVVTTRLVKI